MSPDRHGVCAYCGRSFSTPSRRGKAPSYCCASHRQAAYVERLRERAEATPSSIVSEIAEMRRRLDQIEARVGSRTDSPPGPIAHNTAGEAPSDTGRHPARSSRRDGEG